MMFSKRAPSVGTVPVGLALDLTKFLCFDSIAKVLA